MNFCGFLHRDFLEAEKNFLGLNIILLFAILVSAETTDYRKAKYGGKLTFK